MAEKVVSDSGSATNLADANESHNFISDQSLKTNGSTGPQNRRLVPGQLLQIGGDSSDEDEAGFHQDHDTTDSLKDSVPVNPATSTDFITSNDQEQQPDDTMGPTTRTNNAEPVRRSTPNISKPWKSDLFERDFTVDEPHNPSKIEGKESLPDAKQDKDKSDRATTEQVLDPQTRLLLFQMINSGTVSEINGTISTGKEANVYHALSTSEDDSGPDVHVAIKVYKTSILGFKDRAKYVEGEYRFRKVHKGGDSRAMVRQWALKEMRNLKRIQESCIPCPEPLYLRKHVLAMTLIGDNNGRAAPRLKDVFFDGEDAPAKWRSVYIEVLAYMRILLHECKLVHADLSEYNMLWNDDKPYIIDVSQSVENDHPRSLEFLRTDIRNVSDFFRRQGVAVLSDKYTYNFVVNPENRGDLSLETLRTQVDKIMSERGDLEEDNELENAVFRQQYIPQTLE